MNLQIGTFQLHNILWTRRDTVGFLRISVELQTWLTQILTLTV